MQVSVRRIASWPSGNAASACPPASSSGAGLNILATTGRSSGKSKYRAVPTWVDGIRFPSKKEAARYSELKLLERAGQIRNLELQPAFDITINGVKVGTYRADFSYFTDAGRVVEDTKGMDTRLSKFKRKCVEAARGFKIIIL